MRQYEARRETGLNPLCQVRRSAIRCRDRAATGLSIDSLDCVVIGDDPLWRPLTLTRCTKARNTAELATTSVTITALGVILTDDPGD